MIDEQTLTLYYWNDGLDAAERANVEQALATDHLLAARYRALSERLNALREDIPATAPTHLKHQWHDLVTREARLERQKSAPEPRRFPWLGIGAAFASVLALGIAIGVWMPRGESPVATDVATTESVPPAATLHDGAFERGLRVYLEDRQHQLAGLESRSGDERSTLLLQIVAQNRLFEQAAEKQQSPEIARLMRALEPVLLRLASDEAQGQDAEALQRQLTFEMNALLTKLQAPSSKQTNT